MGMPRDVVVLSDYQFNKLVELLTPGYEMAKAMMSDYQRQADERAAYQAKEVAAAEEAKERAAKAAADDAAAKAKAEADAKAAADAGKQGSAS